MAARFFVAAIAAAVALVLAPAVLAQSPAAPPPPNNYADKATWLCWPGASPNACDVDLTATVVAPDGSTRIEPFRAAANPPIDCFYVYPTVSTDPGILATMAIEPAETRVIEQQFARFGAACRLFAPVYRQFTLTALAAALTGHPLPGSTGARPTTPYDDVRDAWNYYLAHENHGRGVVLIGHSQGSGMLGELIKREIDGKPAQKLLVRAILMGTVLTVPKGADVGGDFKSVPLCRAPAQTGCAIAYASFRDNHPPPANSRFGRPRTPGDPGVAACVNPANLSGGEGELHAYLASGSQMIAGAAKPPPEWAKGKTIGTPFVSLPGMLTARCASIPGFNYLAIHLNPSPSGQRTDDINGDVLYGGQVQYDWGLHLVDANLAMGNLVSLVAA
ncbi:MAG TPA: DUF3089 domain-containing protein, partial [Caulobacteraceae bacterium]|nr:DUF3089 domain-containing protein [Caulobacteraceae bacterium]